MRNHNKEYNLLASYSYGITMIMIIIVYKYGRAYDYYRV